MALRLRLFIYTAHVGKAKISVETGHIFSDLFSYEGFDRSDKESRRGWNWFQSRMTQSMAFSFITRPRETSPSWPSAISVKKVSQHLILNLNTFECDLYIWPYFIVQVCAAKTEEISGYGKSREKAWLFEQFSYMMVDKISFAYCSF